MNQGHAVTRPDARLARLSRGYNTLMRRHNSSGGWSTGLNDAASSGAASHGTGPCGTPCAAGRGCFIAGSIVLILFSLVHMIPTCYDIFVEPTEPAEIAAKEAMAAVTVDIGPFQTHLGKLHLLLSMSYSALLLFVGVANLVALPAVVAHGSLRNLALVNVLFTSILLAISLGCLFPPPAAFSLVAESLFALAMAQAVNARRVVVMR